MSLFTVSKLVQHENVTTSFCENKIDKNSKILKSP